jgi:aminopeptidase N
MLPLTLNYSGIEEVIPDSIAAAASDTTKLKNSLSTKLMRSRFLKKSFGPYQWNKVGYSIVPFGGGAMEHASNIAYPSTLVNGATTYEDFMAHELSHHWFGDLVTCRTVEDMWLNEGWATFCAFLFYEMCMEKKSMQKKLPANHESVVHYATLLLMMASTFPFQEFLWDTYGTTVYNKGADVCIR